MFTMLPLALLVYLRFVVGLGFFDDRLVIVTKVTVVDGYPSCEGQGVITSHVNSVPSLLVACIAYDALT